MATENAGECRRRKKLIKQIKLFGRGLAAGTVQTFRFSMLLLGRVTKAKVYTCAVCEQKFVLVQFVNNLELC